MRSKRITGWTAGLVIAIGLSATAAAATVTVDNLLGEMTDLKRLATLPDPVYTTKQFSSYDQASKSPSEDWFANGDANQYLRIEETEGRKEHVMMDIDGPGAIVRIWSANPKGTLRIYLDGNTKAVLEAPMDAILGGKVPGLPVPIAGERSRGWNLYFPIPYAKHCKVTSDEGGFYYHVNYRTYESGTTVQTFQAADVKRLGEKTGSVASKLKSPRAEVPPPAERTKKPFDATLKPGTDATLWTMDGSNAIVGFLVHLDAKDLETAARAVVLSMTFDGEQTVECPIGDFYGTAPGLNAHTSLPMGITKGEKADLWCHWWMPFEKNARIAVRNLGDQDVRVEGAVAVVPWKWDDKSLHFHAKWRIERDIPARPQTDWAHLECKGKGRFVGGHLHILNTVKTWWGEGDEKIYVDGEKFPSHFGTGTEDYYGYAWCSNEVFFHAYHNQPRCDGPGNFGNSSVSRWHIIDDIPFTTQFKFDIENWHGGDRGKTNRAAVSYWYARPGGSDFFKPITREDVKLDVIEMAEMPKVPGAIEGEGLKVLETTAGTTTKQDVSSYDGDLRWSNGVHLWWTQAKPGDKLTLAFDAPEAGRKNVIVQLTKAVDYAKVQLHVNGKKAGDVIDLFNQGVVPTGPIDLGAFDLVQGQNKLTVEIVGANDKAVKSHMVGLDYILLK